MSYLPPPGRLAVRDCVCVFVCLSVCTAGERCTENGGVRGRGGDTYSNPVCTVNPGSRNNFMAFEESWSRETKLHVTLYSSTEFDGENVVGCVWESKEEGMRERASERERDRDRERERERERERDRDRDNGRKGR